MTNQTKKANNHKARQRLDESYLNPGGIKSTLVSGNGLGPGQWMDPIETIHDDGDDPLTAYE